MLTQFKRFLRILLFLFCLNSSSYLMASDLVVNLVPNPVAAGEPIRISLSSETPLDDVKLNVGATDYPLQQISDQIYRVTILAYANLFSSNPTLIIVTAAGERLVIPVDIKQKERTEASDQSILSGFDVKENKQQSLDNSQEEIDLLQDKIDLFEKERRDLKSKIDDLQNQLDQERQNEEDAKLLEKQKKELEKLQKDLEEQEKEKEKLINDLMERMKNYNEKQEEINKREAILNKLEESIEERSSEIEQKELTLEEKSKELSQEEREMEERNSILSQKELTLSSLKNDLEKRNIELDFRKKQISKQERLIKDQNKKVLRDKSDLEREKRELNSLNKSISEQQESLSELSRELKQRQEDFNKEQQKEYKNNAEKERALKDRESYIFKLQTQLNDNIDNIKDLEQIQQKKEEAFQVKVVDYQDKLREVNDLRIQLEKEKSLQEDVELEIAIKYELLNKLSAVIQRQLDEIRTEYKTIQNTQNQYVSDLDQRVHYLTTLSYLMEKQTKEIEARNEALQKKNTKLKYKLEKSAYHAYSIYPYIGLKVRNDDNYDNKEYGIKWTTYFGTRYMASAGFAFIDYLHDPGNGNTSNVNQKFVLFDVGYLLTHTKKSDLYFTIGLEADLFSDINYGYVNYGLNYRYYMKNDIVTRLGLRVSNVITAEVGFEKYFGPMRRQTIAEPEVEEEEPEVEVESIAVLDVIIDQKQTYYRFKPRDVALPDLNTHWSKNTSIRISKLGIIEPILEGEAYSFKPNQPLTYIEASKMLLNTYYAQELINTDAINVDFSLVGVTDQPVQVDFSVFDEEMSLLKKFNIDKAFYPGNHSISLDATVKNQLTDSKNYVLRVDTKKRSLVRGKKSYELDNSVVSSAEKAFTVNYIHALDEHPDYAFLSYKNMSFETINKKLNVELFDKSLSGSENRAITRLDFMLATSKLLIKMGATHQDIEVDFSYYKDADMLTEEQKQQLRPYVIELGYGGSDKQRLNPNQTITRAEAATIIYRILFWDNQRLIDKVFGN